MVIDDKKIGPGIVRAAKAPKTEAIDVEDATDDGDSEYSANDKFTATYVTWHTPLCLSCKWRDDVSVPRNCLAFPEGIPTAILMGDADHTKPYKGDNGLQYMKGEPSEVDYGDE